MKALTAGSERKLTDHETEELSHDKWQSLVYNQRSLMFRDGCVKLQHYGTTKIFPIRPKFSLCTAFPL